MWKGGAGKCTSGRVGLGQALTKWFWLVGSFLCLYLVEFDLFGFTSPLHI